MGVFPRPGVLLLALPAVSAMTAFGSASYGSAAAFRSMSSATASG